MSVYAVEMRIDTAFAAQVRKRWLVACAEAALEGEEQPPGSGLSIVVTDDAQIQRLNRDYRGIDRPTDVLAFATADATEDEGQPFVLPEEEALYLGDVIISYPTALAQAGEQGHPVKKEIALLVVHGCLHLLGYDHADPDQQREMWDRQEAILSAIEG